MKRNGSKIFIVLILMLCLFKPSIVKAQVIYDTLFVFPDTTEFFDRDNGLVTDDMSNFAVKFSPDSSWRSFKIEKIQILLFDSGLELSVFIKISVGHIPDEKILYEKYFILDSTYSYFSEWHTFIPDTDVLLDSLDTSLDLFISGTILKFTAGSEYNYPVKMNQFYFNPINSTWYEGLPVYLPVKVVVERIISEVNEHYHVVNGYHLYQNYPNPFNPSTKISYYMKESGFVSLKVYDILGNEIIRLVNTTQQAGNHSVEFNAVNLPSGVYIFTVKVNGYSASKKMILLK